MPEIKGLLEAFFETGTEGVIWSVYDEAKIDADGKRSYEGLHPLKKGDILKVFADVARSEVLWEGVVDLETERNYHPYPLNPQYGQQAVLGMWVHGLQRDLEPETWARMFFEEKPCILIPAEGPPVPAI